MQLVITFRCQNDIAQMKMRVDLLLPRLISTETYASQRMRVDLIECKV